MSKQRRTDHELKAEDIAWVAGVFEGEGCIRVRKDRYGAQVSVRMDDRDVIERIHSIMGFGNLYELQERRAADVPGRDRMHAVLGVEVCQVQLSVAIKICRIHVDAVDPKSGRDQLLLKAAIPISN